MRELVVELALGAAASTCFRSSAPTPAARTSRRAPAATSRSRSTSEAESSSSSSSPSGRPTSPSTRRTGAWCGPAGRHRRTMGPGRRPDRRDPPGDGRASSPAASRSRRAPLGDGATRRWATSSCGCVVEIKSGAVFVAERGAGIEIRGRRRAGGRAVALSANDRPRTDVLDARLPRPAGGAADRRCSRS